MRKYSLLAIGLCGLILNACSTIDTTREYSDSSPRNADLVVPPGLSSPELSTSYAFVGGTSAGNASLQSGYQLDKVKDMQIIQGGSQRWLVIDNKKVDQVWQMMLSYINQLGLTVKYQNPSVGLIQTDWATRNTNVKETGVRGLFASIGWGGIYSLSAQYMYRVTLWQNESNTLVFVTNYQMDEVYPGCITNPNMNKNYTTSDQTTKWMPVQSDPQLELNFLMQFMGFAGFSQEQVKQAVATVVATPKQAQLNLDQITINDTFDRAWWRTGLALERAGLGINDKNRETGEYYVYKLQSQIDNSNNGWFGGSKDDLVMPKPVYTIKLVASGDKTILTLSPYPNTVVEKDFNADRSKYLNSLLQQLQ